MSFIINSVTTCPEYVVQQADIKKLLTRKWPDKTDFIHECIDNSAVEKRYFTLPLNYYQDLFDIGKKNIIWKAEALRLQKENIKNM